MNHNQLSKRVSSGVMSVLLLALATTIMHAQSGKLEGVIKARSGEIMTIQAADSTQTTVVLTNGTQVGQIQGVLQARRKDMSAAALIPGLAVQVEGSYNDQRELVATLVKFKGTDLAQAQKIQAGMHETKVRSEQNEMKVQQQKEELQRQEAALKETQRQANRNKEELEKHSAAIQENKAAIAAAVARFGQLDDYYILDEVSVYFGNGKVNVEAKYNPELLRLAEKAKTVKGYMIEVKGYASTSGSVALNQKLSEDRAASVVNILLQQGHIPLVHMLAPGAMGESGEMESRKASDAGAENRRVVVRVLQNKGIAGV